MKTTAKKENDVESLHINHQQRAQLMQAQMDLNKANDTFKIVVAGILAAARIEKAEMIGGDMEGDMPYLSIRRK